MLKISLRQVGSSHLIEGLATPGIDAESLRHELAEAHGPAVGVVGWTPKPLSPADLQVSSLIQAVILDRKAMSAAQLRRWLSAWAERQGWSSPAWSEAESDHGLICVLTGEE